VSEDQSPTIIFYWCVGLKRAQDHIKHPCKPLQFHSQSIRNSHINRENKEKIGNAVSVVVVVFCGGVVQETVELSMVRAVEEKSPLEGRSAI
jgi:hypothetical protein